MTNKTDSNKKKNFPIISIYFLGFIISIFFEFYWINYFPYDYFMLFGIGIILCIFGYLTIDALVDMIQNNAARREAQNEVMIKASKAIYVTAKKIITETQQSGTGAASSAKNIQALLNDLTLANERLAREIESAVSLQAFRDENSMEPDVPSTEDASVEPVPSTEDASVEPVASTSEPAKEQIPSDTEAAAEQISSTAEIGTEELKVTSDQNQKLTEEQIAQIFADL